MRLREKLLDKAVRYAILSCRLERLGRKRLFKCLRRVVGDEKPAHSTPHVRQRFLKEVRDVFPVLVAHDVQARKIKRAASAVRAANFIKPADDDDEKHLVWLLGMSIEDARKTYIPGPMRHGRPDMEKWQYGVHAHPSLWGGFPVHSAEVLPQPRQESGPLEAILYDFKLRNLARQAVCQAMGESQTVRIYRTHDEWCGEISKLTEGDLMREPNFGIVSLNIVKEYLGQRGLLLAAKR